MLLITLACAATLPASAGMRGRMLHLINGVRRSHHEHALRLSIPVSRSAHHHSNLMAGRGYLFHTPNLQQVVAGRPWSVLGENVAEAKTVRSTFRAWMHSPGHRANILKARYKRIGIGIVSSHHELWSTTDFWG
jgi:uncharacterized protein YkwD